LADLAGGGKKPISGADGKPWNDESDWEHWLEVIDKADAEDQILTALEVRLHVGRSRERRDESKASFSRIVFVFPRRRRRRARSDSLAPLVLALKTPF
jgi:hypothetical protein